MVNLNLPRGDVASMSPQLFECKYLGDDKGGRTTAGPVVGLRHLAKVLAAR